MVIFLYVNRPFPVGAELKCMNEIEKKAGLKTNESARRWVNVDHRTDSELNEANGRSSWVLEACMRAKSQLGNSAWPFDLLRHLDTSPGDSGAREDGGYSKCWS